MKNLKLCVTAGLVFAIATAQAATPVRNDFDNGMGTDVDNTTDLMKETKNLSLDSESPVSSVEDKSSSFISVAGGIVTGGSLQTNTNGNTVNYDLGRAIPLFSVSYAYFPENQHRKWGNLGLQVSLGYAYSEFDQVQDTTLTLIPIELAVAYRYEKSTSQVWVPFAKAGPSEWIWVQRGVDELNNSAAVFGGEITGGVSFKLRAIGLASPREEPEAYFAVQRNIFGGGNSNFNGTAFQLGAVLAL